MESPFQILREKCQLSQSELALQLDLSRETVLAYENALAREIKPEVIYYMNGLAQNFYPAPAYENFLSDYGQYKLYLRTQARPTIQRHKPRHPVGFREWRGSFIKSSRAFAKLVAVPTNDVVAFEEGRYLTSELRQALLDVGIDPRRFGPW